MSEGRDPYQVWRGAWMVGQQHARLGRRAEFGENLRGSVEHGLTVTTADLAAAEAARLAVFHRFRALVRALRCLAHARRAGEALSRSR